LVSGLAASPAARGYLMRAAARASASSERAVSPVAAAV
jgi:hypothetical protein